MPENESKKKKRILLRLYHKNQQIKKLRNKPNQEVKDLYAENYKILIEETADDSQKCSTFLIACDFVRGLAPHTAPWNGC